MNVADLSPQSSKQPPNKATILKICHMTGLRNDNLSKQVVNQWILTHLRPQPFQRRCTLRHFCRSFFPGVWRWHIRGARGRRLQTATATSSVWPHALQDTARVLGAVQAGVRDRKRVLWASWKIWEKDPGSQNQSKGIYIIWKLNNKIPIDVWFVRIGQIVWLFDHTTISPPSRTSTTPVSPAKPSALQVIPPTRHTTSSVCYHQGGDWGVSKPGTTDWKTASSTRLSGSWTPSRPWPPSPLLPHESLNSEHWIFIYLMFYFIFFLHVLICIFVIVAFLCTYMYVCMYICMYMCMYVYVYVYICVYIYMYMYIYMYVYVCVYIYIYIFDLYLSVFLRSTVSV